MLVYNCKICGFSTTLSQKFNEHLSTLHNLQQNEYYKQYINTDPNVGICAICKKPTRYYGLVKGYNKYCSHICAGKVEDRTSKECKMECQICHEKFESNDSLQFYSMLSGHFRTKHGISIKDYYDKFHKKDDEGICLCCGKETDFKSFSKGYKKFCSRSCVQHYKLINENSFDSKLNALRKIDEENKKIANETIEKYNNFIKNDKYKQFDDTRCDEKVLQKLIKDNKTIETIEGDKIEVKTEIAVQSQRSQWIGNQNYTPIRENCSYLYNNFYDDINDDQNFSSSEWC